MTKVELELISDADMFLVVEKDTRGGFLAFLKDTVKSTLSIWNLMIQNKNQSIIYLDANNLYGFGMSTILPTDRFKWTDSEEFEIVQRVMLSKLILGILKN